MQVAVELEQAERRARPRCACATRASASRRSERKRIFKRFYRIPGAVSTRVKGTGLGLFIVRSVVAAPRRQGVRRERRPGPAAARSSCSCRSCSSLRAMSRILVVEDEQHLADGLRFNLEAEQHDVDLVDSGEEALERLTRISGRYDLVILDVMLPGIDGFARRRQSCGDAGRSCRC